MVLLSHSSPRSIPLQMGLLRASIRRLGNLWMLQVNCKNRGKNDSLMWVLVSIAPLMYLQVKSLLMLARVPYDLLLKACVLVHSVYDCYQNQMRALQIIHNSGVTFRILDTEMLQKRCQDKSGHSSSKWCFQLSLDLTNSLNWLKFEGLYVTHCSLSYPMCLAQYTSIGKFKDKTVSH